MSDRTALLDLSYPQLEKLLTSWEEPSYRTQQLWEWLYHSLADDFSQMSNLPRELREKLEEAVTLQPLGVLDQITSPSGLTQKLLLGLADGETIESVLMRYRRRNSVCVSTQVGCAIGCPFCATGQSGFTRNLTPGEIVGQVLHFARLLGMDGQKVTNVVLMGMGEPLANYEAMWQAVEVLHDRRGFNLGARRITISTAGLVPGIQRLSGEELQVGLAISLHAAEDRLRDDLVPLNRRYPLAQLMEACQSYVERTGRRITIEYALIHGINDDIGQAQALGQLLQGLNCQVNFIRLNPILESEWQPSSRKRVGAFQAMLDGYGIRSTVRVRRGIDIQAGCGQLRSRSVGRKLNEPGISN
ncbi:MAG: 23S rRNA (adenine(2503)-C(2))-methyltransferase RlmN [Anaerolineae bacterium]